MRDAEDLVTDEDVTQINALAALLRQVDGRHELGAAALAEALVALGVTVSTDPVVDDQPTPIDNGRPFVQPAALPFMLDRFRLGVHRYKVGLQPFNRRKSIRDLKDEIGDALNYVTQFEYEQAEIAETAHALMNGVDAIPLGENHPARLHSRRLRELLQLAGY